MGESAALSLLVYELREKYAEMLAMRLAERRRPRPGQSEVRSRMMALAARFPGSLREIDEIELVEIRRRIALLDRVVAGGPCTEGWVEATALFHRLARGALSAKRWLGGRRRVTPSMAEDFERTAAALPYGKEALEWRAELALVAAPPQGRITRAVHRRVAAKLGITEAEARLRVLAPSGRRAGRGGRGR
jgi:hypothetical protein